MFSHLSHMSNKKAIVFEILYFLYFLFSKETYLVSYLLTFCSKIVPSFFIYCTNITVKNILKITHSLSTAIVFRGLCLLPVLVSVNMYSNVPISNHS